ncbi:hypothetical protein BD560DRAFT_323673, partial [Blakeslea trispora]
YSCELNPMEQFWLVVQIKKVKRHPLKDTGTLTARKIEAREAVPTKHLQHFISCFFQEASKTVKKASNQSNNTTVTYFHATHF